jgi:predicted anti-sigma-YlaC factor YlaD
MKCRKVEKNLIHYLEKDLPNEKYLSIRDHLDSCDHCTKLLHEVQLTLQVITHEQVKETNPFFYTRLKQRIESETGNSFIPAKEKAWKRILYPALYSVFIAFAILMGIYIGIGQTGKVPEINREEYIQAYSQSSHIYEMDEEFIENNLLSDNSTTDNSQK